jgi:hypothetical protein
MIPIDLAGARARDVPVITSEILARLPRLLFLSTPQEDDQKRTLSAR